MKTMTRREAAQTFLVAIGGALFAGCSSTGLTGVDAGSPTHGWASGGTRSMTGNYPDPFATPVTSCVLLAITTAGPCTEAADQERKDISEGYTGLPVRLALKVVNEACEPIAGAKVKVWHTQISGSYSGSTPNNGMCLEDQSDSSKHYFRGAQTTDAAGRVDFDTCFPGWYRGRAIHIHYSVSLGGRSFTSQLAFDQALIDEIFASHPEYEGYGQPDTTNAGDNIVRGDSYLLQTSRMRDGAMMAAKVLVVNV
jgi:protocatechuate 3,4-dioxygenase beta subunit